MPFIIYLTSFLLYLKITANYQREYKFYNSNSTIDFNNKTVTIREIVDLFKPFIYQYQDLRGPKPEKMLFEVIPHNSESIYIVYRIYWSTETHPKLILRYVYDIFRWSFFGSIIDLEFYEIKINLNSGKIEQIKFETELHNNQDVSLPVHTKLTIIPKSNDNWVAILNETTKINTYKLDFSDNHVHLQVSTWNHLFNNIIDKKNSISYDLPLFELTNGFYKKYKFDTRSFGSFGKFVNKKERLKHSVIISLSFTFLSILWLILILF